MSENDRQNRKKKYKEEIHLHIETKRYQSQRSNLHF